MHYAAMVGVKRTGEKPLEVFKDIEGIKNIAELSRQYKVKKILFTSSSEVYGEPVKLPIAEDDTFNSKWPYGLVKILGEQYFLAHYEKYGIPVTIIRFFNVYGPRQDFGDSGFVVLVFLNNALKRKPLEIYGDGEQRRDFTFVDDCNQANMKACFAPGVQGRRFNVARGSMISVNELFRKLARLSGSGIEPEYAFARKGDVRDSLADISAAREALSYEPAFDMDAGLARTFDWYSDIIGKVA